MGTRTIAQKLGIKEGMNTFLKAVPPDYYEITNINLSHINYDLKDRPLDFVHVFSTEEQALITELESIIPNLSRSGMLWISWPKKSSKIPSSLDKRKVMNIGQAAGLVDVKILSYNIQWSALKFVYRLKDR